MNGFLFVAGLRNASDTRLENEHYLFTDFISDDILWGQISI